MERVDASAQQQGSGRRGQNHAAIHRGTRSDTVSRRDTGRPEGRLDFDRFLWIVNLDYEGFQPYAVTFAKLQRGCPVCDENKIAEFQVDDSVPDTIS